MSIEDNGQQAGQGSGDGAQAGKDDRREGSVKEALKQEREARRSEKAEFEKRIADLEKRVQGRQAPEQQQGPGSDLGEFTITQDEWDTGDVEAISAKITKAMRSAASAGRQAVEKRWGEMTAAQQAEALIGKFEIFHDEDDPDLAEDAAFAAQRAIEALGDGATFEQKAEAVETQAKRFSRYKAGRRSERGDDTRDPMPTGSGTAEAAHVSTKHDRPKTTQEARSLAGKLARKAADRLGLRWE